jgi:hypothetical protein
MRLMNVLGTKFADDIIAPLEAGAFAAFQVKKFE